MQTNHKRKRHLDQPFASQILLFPKSPKTYQFQRILNFLPPEVHFTIFHKALTAPTFLIRYPHHRISPISHHYYFHHF